MTDSTKTGFKKPLRSYGKSDTASTPNNASDFIAQADAPPKVSSDHIPASFPWDGLNNTRTYGAFNLRLTEYQQARLKFAADNSEFSMHSIAHQAMMARVDEIIEGLLKD